MASIRERGPQKYELRVFVGYDDRGRPRQVSRTFEGSRRAAEKRAHELEKEYATVGVSALERTVAVALEEWQEAHVEWARLTKRDYASRARLVVEDSVFAGTRLDRLRRSDLDAWIKRMRTAAVPETAIKNRVAVVRSAVAHAVEAEHLHLNPIAGYRLRQPKREKPAQLEDETVAACLTAAAKLGRVEHLGVRLACVAALRRSEAAAITWTSRKGNELSVTGQVYVEDGIRKVDQFLKSNASYRKVVLDDETVRLWELAEESQEFPSRYVFGEPGTDGPPSPDRPTRLFKKALALAGLQPTRLHATRHWSASNALSAGRSVVDVADRLGNTPETVVRTYAHVTAASKRATADALGSLVDGLDLKQAQ